MTRDEDGVDSIVGSSNDPDHDDNGGSNHGNNNNDDNDVDVDDDDESDYSYTYDDEEEEYSGFLIPTVQPPVRVEEDAPVASSTATTLTTADAAASDHAKATTTTTDDSNNNNNSNNESPKKWIPPPPEAITMSLRAQSESTGSRRRLASDLYKIMMSTTSSSGFTLSPSCEDSMDKWSIRLFGFDEDSNLAKDLRVVGLDCVELEMSFPDQYPFEPPFVRVVTPKFVRQTGFVMNGALCMELLTRDGWNPINDIESVIVSIRSLMVVGDGRVKAAVDMGEKAYEEALMRAEKRKKEVNGDGKRKRGDSSDGEEEKKGSSVGTSERKTNVGSYSAAEASSAYEHLSKYHEEKGWDKSGWWAKRG